MLAFGERVLPLAVILVFVENVPHYSLGIWLPDHRARLLTLRRNPVIAASLAEMAVSLLGIELWSPFYPGIKMLGDVSIPLLLFSPGVRLTESTLRDVRLGAIGAVGCPLFGALPPAVLNFVFAEKYRQEPERVASIVMLGNLGSLLFVPLALALVLR